MSYIEDLLRELANEGVHIVLSWCDSQRMFHAEARIDNGTYLSVYSLTLEGVIDALNEACGEYLVEYC